MGSTSNVCKMTTAAASIGSAVLYGITSTSMAFLNKLVLDVYTYNYPMVIMTLQMVVSFIIVYSMNRCGYIKLKELTRDNLIMFLGPSFFYSLNGVLSLAALGHMNITMYSVIKRNGPLVTMVLSYIFLKKGMPGRFVIFGVLLMTFGCIIAAEGAGSVLSQALYLILLQRISDSFSTFDTLYMNSILSFPVLAISSTVFGEFSRASHYSGYRDVGYIVSMATLLLMGSFLNFTLFLCNSNNSALTTSVVGTLKSVAQTTMGMFTFGGVSINTAMITGVSMNMFGGIVYTWAKYKESRKKKTTIKSHPSEATLHSMEEGTTASQHRTDLNHTTSVNMPNSAVHSEERKL